jgi:hypothetical protein
MSRHAAVAARCENAFWGGGHSPRDGIHDMVLTVSGPYLSESLMEKYVFIRACLSDVRVVMTIMRARLVE